MLRVWRAGLSHKTGHGALLFLNATAATLYITFAVMRHVPLEAFPIGWRSTLLRWRRSRRVPKRTSAGDDASVRGPARKDPFAPTQQSDARFKAWPTLNESIAAAAAAGVSKRARIELGSPPLDALWPGSSLAERFSRELAARHAVDRKEFFESWEFFAQARSGLHSAAGCGTFIELAAGHGLLGVLVALFEPRRFPHVILADRRRPASFDAVLEAAAAVSPSVVERIEYVEEDFLGGSSSGGAKLLPRGAAVACVHACKSLTDAIIQARRPPVPIDTPAVTLLVHCCCTAVTLLFQYYYTTVPTPLQAASDAGVESVVCMPCCYGHSAAAEKARSLVTTPYRSYSYPSVATTPQDSSLALAASHHHTEYRQPLLPRRRRSRFVARSALAWRRMCSARMLSRPQGSRLLGATCPCSSRR